MAKDAGLEAIAEPPGLVAEAIFEALKVEPSMYGPIQWPSNLVMLMRLTRRPWLRLIFKSLKQHLELSCLIKCADCRTGSTSSVIF